MAKRRIGCKSQGSPEFNVVISFVMLVFLVVVLIVLQKQDESYKFQRYLDAKRVATSIADNINMISINGHGYYRYFSVPDTLYGNTEYEVSASDNFLWINYSDENAVGPLVTENVTIVRLEKGEDELNCVSNHHGEVVISDICGLSDQGCGSVQSCDPGDLDTCPTCDTPDPVEIHQNSISECPYYGCSTDEWHIYKIIPDRDGNLKVTFQGTGTMSGLDKTDMVFYDYTANGCSSPDVIFQLETQTSHIFTVQEGDTYILGLDVDALDCSYNGTYQLTMELK